MAGPFQTIAAPTRAARLGGIATVASIDTDTRLGIGEQVVYQTDGCEFPNTEVLRCFAEAPVPDKTYSGITTDFAIGDIFTIFAGVRCFVNSAMGEFLGRAERQLAAGHDRILEEVYSAWADDGTALDAGGSIVNSIALVDQELDDKYIGRGVIAMSRFDAVLADAAGALELGPDGVATTINGTPVFASGRITPGTVYGTGAIGITRTPTESYEATEHGTNNHFALAEARFVLAVDCDFRVKSATAASNG